MLKLRQRRLFKWKQSKVQITPQSPMRPWDLEILNELRESMLELLQYIREFHSNRPWDGYMSPNFKDIYYKTLIYAKQFSDFIYYRLQNHRYFFWIDSDILAGTPHPPYFISPHFIEDDIYFLENTLKILELL